MSHAGSTAMTAAVDGRQFLTFILGGQHYGLPILRVQEIRAQSTVTPLPNAPGDLKGVVNLRGTIIPVVDLRTRFGMPAETSASITVIIVVTVGPRTLGLVVDAVSDVITVPPADIQAAPDFGSRLDVRFLSGIVGAGDTLVILLDIDRVLEDGDLAG